MWDSLQIVLIICGCEWYYYNKLNIVKIYVYENKILST